MYLQRAVSASEKYYKPSVITQIQHKHNTNTQRQHNKLKNKQHIPRTGKIVVIQFHSIQQAFLTCRLNITNANHEASTKTKYKTKSI